MDNKKNITTNSTEADETEKVSYNKKQIQLALDILNQMNFVGIQQAQGIAQISVILGNPLEE